MGDSLIKKIIIIVILIFIFALIGLNYINDRFQDYEFIITSIDENTITTEAKSGEDISTGEIFYTRYKFSVNDVLVLNESNKKINASELQVGDKIFVINKREKVENDLYSDPEYLNNVKIIKILKTD